MAKEFDYGLFQLAAKIYQYAERVVSFPNDEHNVNYCKEQCRAALQECREKSATWLPVSESYKGKSAKKIGTCYVTVQIPAGSTDNQYGFSYHQNTANRIYENLRNMYIAYTHNEELDTVLAQAK